MISRVLYFDQQPRVIGKTNISIGRFLWRLSVGFSLLTLLVTSGVPGRSGLVRLASPPSVPLVSSLPRPATETPPEPVPVLAYYYIWFDAQSWQRAKSDYPLLGKYS